MVDLNQDVGALLKSVFSKKKNGSSTQYKNERSGKTNSSTIIFVFIFLLGLGSLGFSAWFPIEAFLNAETLEDELISLRSDKNISEKKLAQAKLVFDQRSAAVDASAGLFSNQAEVEEFFDLISKRAVDFDLTIFSVDRLDDDPQLGNPTNSNDGVTPEYLVKRPGMSLDVHGNFGSLYQFFLSLSQLPQAVEITELTIQLRPQPQEGGNSSPQADPLVLSLRLNLFRLVKNSVGVTE